MPVPPGGITVDEPYRVGLEAYRLLLPPVLSELARRAMTADGAPRASGCAPENQLGVVAVPGADAGLCPRVDLAVLTAHLWLDVRRDPVAIVIPELGGRAFLMKIVSMWTRVVACYGSLRPGPRRALLVADHDWSGTATDGIDVVRLPGGRGRLIATVKLETPGDIEEVRRTREWFSRWRVAPLAAFGHDRAAQAVLTQARTGERPSAPSAPSAPNGPVEQVRSMNPREFFELGCALIHSIPAAREDAHLLDRMMRLGLRPTTRLPWSALDATVRRGLHHAAAIALGEIERSPLPGATIRGWTIDRESAHHYRERAVAAFHGLLAPDLVHELSACSCADGQDQPLSGAARYRLRFDHATIPPADCSWSLTLYDVNGVLAPNAIERHAVHGNQVRRSSTDGSIDICLQRHPPPPEAISGWLPTPSGRFELQLRLYWPKTEAQTGRWSPPPIERIT